MATKGPAPLAPGQLERLCQILADTVDGLTGTEIERILRQCNIVDREPTATKWKRLLAALSHRQTADKSADRVLAFIASALEPARYVGQQSVFRARRTGVNAVLALYGLEFQEDGKFRRVQRATTLGEAEARAHRLRAALSARGVHQHVLAACRSELLEDNCFHAVLEATKSVAAKLRSRTGATSDGSLLVDEALSGSNPKLRINDLRNESELGEQRGFMNLLKGLFGTFRNPLAHEARIAWPVSEEDALDLFSLASYAHRRLDSAK
jgi:uncharacterized protein (TIGR02391 family)